MLHGERIMIDDLILKDSYFQDHDDYAINKDNMQSFWQITGKEILTTTVQRFGIEDLLNRVKGAGGLDDYQLGGSVSTKHNAHNGIFVDAEHKASFEEPYDRKNYEGIAANNNTLHQQRKARFKDPSPLYDEYTGKRLSKDGSTNLDHIVSAKRIHENETARLFMSREQRNNMAVSKENMAFTSEQVNKSKGELSMKEWLNKEHNGITNSERFGIDPDKALSKEKKAEKFINRNVNKAVFNEVKEASFANGKMQVKRQTIGIVFYYFSEIFIDEMARFATAWKKYHGISERVAAIKDMGSRIKERVIERIKNIKELIGEVVQGAIEGFFSGIIGIIVTTLINMVVSTVKSVGKILQDGISALISAVKLWGTNPEHLEKGELVKKITKMVGGTISGTLGLIFEQKVKSVVLTILALASFAEPIGIISGILVTGCLTGLIFYVVDNFSKIIDSFKAVFSDIKYGLTVSAKEIKERYQTALKKIDEAYVSVLTEIEEYYEKLGKLADLAHDMGLPANVQVTASIDYARASGVSENKILHNISEADDYFLN